MQFHNLVPFSRDRQSSVRTNGDASPSVGSETFPWGGALEPFFQSFFRGFPMMSDFARSSVDFAPALDISETEEEYKVHAELPGLDADDVELSLEEGILTISGEKTREERSEKENVHRVERSFGSFRRSIRLPIEVDADKIEAAFDKGVLEVRLPKKAETIERVKKIAVKSR